MTERLKSLLHNPSLTNGSAQPRPPDSGRTADYFMEGEPVVSRRGVLHETLTVLFLCTGNGEEAQIDGCRQVRDRIRAFVESLPDALELKGEQGRKCRS